MWVLHVFDWSKIDNCSMGALRLAAQQGAVSPVDLKPALLVCFAGLILPPTWVDLQIPHLPMSLCPNLSLKGKPPPQ